MTDLENPTNSGISKNFRKLSSRGFCYFCKKPHKQMETKVQFIIFFDTKYNLKIWTKSIVKI